MMLFHVISRCLQSRQSESEYTLFPGIRTYEHELAWFAFSLGILAWSQKDEGSDSALVNDCKNRSVPKSLVTSLFTTEKRLTAEDGCWLYLGISRFWRLTSLTVDCHRSFSGFRSLLLLIFSEGFQSAAGTHAKKRRSQGCAKDHDFGQLSAGLLHQESDLFRICHKR